MTKSLALLVLLAAAAACQNTPLEQEIPTSQLPGGLKGEITLLAKKTNVLSIAVKITNEGKRGDAHILLYGRPSVFDDLGNRYEARGPSPVAGVAYCQGPMTNPPTFRLCVGVPRVDDAHFFPLSNYTDIEQGKAVTVHFTLYGGRESVGKGSYYTFSQDVAYRFASFDADGGMSDQQKLKSLHFGALSFSGAKSLLPNVQSGITFDPPK